MSSGSQPMDLRGSPMAFRSVARIMARNWALGALDLELPDGRVLCLDAEDGGPRGRVIVRDYRFIHRVLRTGTIGFGEGYMAGEWDTPDLSRALEVLALNFAQFEGVSFGNTLGTALNLIGHTLRGNSRSGSKRNIHAHYDLGNAFYSRWLDPSMTYSSARFAAPEESLPDAQQHKYQTLAESMGLQADHHVLEIG